MRNRKIFAKVFTYTVFSTLLLAAITAALFSRQFWLFYRTIEAREIVASYEPLVKRLQRNDSSSTAELAQLFYENNQSFEFYIADKDGGSIFATPNADTDGDFGGDFYYVVHNGAEYSIIAQSRTGLGPFYRDLTVRALAVFAVILALCLACAFVFARQMTKPIERLAESAGKMARLEDVPPEPERQDELGDLARDVHSMYDKLKETIQKLESEIQRERELEETQRYFFSAASHELKTPIAATSVLLEGMLANVGDYKDHPKYLRECLKMAGAQSKTISEILELVSLSDGKIVPIPERLDLWSAVAELLPTYQTLAEAESRRIALDIPNGQACLADPKMLQKALSNIILNAVQNTPMGGAVCIRSEPVAKGYRLCVLNTGARIDETVLLKLFEPFYRMDMARMRKDGRSGLGLAIVQKTLESMGVPFALENISGGVQFWLDLPRA
jgi:two-component system sensor histidine kinase VanS